jgi:hypothetical protein
MKLRTSESDGESEPTSRSIAPGDAMRAPTFSAATW